MSNLTVTESALARLDSMIRTMKAALPTNACFRFEVDADGDLALFIDAPTPEDNTFYFDEVAILVISEAIAEQNAGRTLDVNAAGDFVLI